MNIFDVSKYSVNGHKNRRKQNECNVIAQLINLIENLEKILQEYGKI